MPMTSIDFSFFCLMAATSSMLMNELPMTTARLDSIAARQKRYRVRMEKGCIYALEFGTRCLGKIPTCLDLLRVLSVPEGEYVPEFKALYGQAARHAAWREDETVVTDGLAALGRDRLRLRVNGFDGLQITSTSVYRRLFLY